MIRCTDSTVVRHLIFYYLSNTRKMSLRKVGLALLTISVIASGSVSAMGQTAPAPGAVSLDSCRAMALNNNRQLRARSEAIKMTGYQKKEALAAYLPALDFEGGYMYNQKNIAIFGSDQLLPTKTFDPATQSYQFNIVKNPATGQPVLGPGNQPIPETVALIPKEAMTYNIHNVFGGAVTLTQPIFMGGKIVAMNRLTHYAEKLAQAAKNAEAENVIYAVDAAYWQVVSLKAKKKLADSYVNLLDTLTRNVRLMVEQGVATPSDLLSVEVKLNSAQVDQTKVDNGLTLSRMALAQVCGLPVDTVFPLADEDADLTVQPSMAATTYNMQEVYDRRQDLRALQAGIDILHQKANVAKSEMMPSLALIDAYSFSNPNMFDGFRRRLDGAFSVGAVLRIPLWHWGGNYNKYRAARSMTTIARIELEDARRMVELQVSQSAFRSREAVKTYQMTETNLRKADENLRQANLAFREGVMTTDNVMAAQTAWLKAHSEQIDAGIDMRLCDVYLSKVLGTLPYTREGE